MKIGDLARHKIHEIKKSKQYYICPQCYKYIQLECDYSLTTTIVMEKEDADNFGYVFKRHEFECYCSRCDTYMFDCDEEMVKYVLAFHRSGYETSYCCQGHNNTGAEGQVEYPYLQYIHKPGLDFIRDLYNESKHKDILAYEENFYPEDGGYYSNHLSINLDGINFDDRNEFNKEFERRRKLFFNFLDQIVDRLISASGSDKQ